MMGIEEMMIDYVMYKASKEEVEEFFGYSIHNGCTREECESNIAQMPDDVFDTFVRKFGISADG